MFDQSAAFYDAIYTRMKNYEEEARRVRAWIEKARPGARTVLDVACGTGEHDKYLKMHYSVDGTDINEDFLAIARGKNPEGRYLQADMTTLELGRKYDVVLCLFSAIGYMLDQKSLVQALKGFVRHLEPGGVAIVEPWFTPETWKPGKPSMQMVDEEGLKICRMNYTETRGRLSHFVFHFLVGTPEGVRHFEEPHTMGLFTVEENLAAFREAGFEVKYDPRGVFGRGLYLGTLP